MTLFEKMSPVLVLDGVLFLYGLVAVAAWQVFTKRLAWQLMDTDAARPGANDWILGCFVGAVAALVWPVVILVLGIRSLE